MTAQHKTPALYAYGRVHLYKSYTQRGREYYTVVNCALGVHRHYRFYKEALMMCKRAGQGRVPEHYSSKAKRDLLYLTTGDESYRH